MPTPRPPRWSSRRAGGFTLVEMLIVVAILVTLIGILVPVVGHARQQASRTKCAANLMSLGQAMTAYAGEHNSVLPTCGAQFSVTSTVPKSSDWTGWGGVDATNMCDYLEECALAKYLGVETPGNTSQLNLKLRQKYLCPGVGEDRGTAPYPFDYSMNAQLSGIPIERVQDGGQKAMLVEAVNSGQKNATSAYFYWSSNPGLPNVNGVQSVQGQIDNKRHGHNNTLFADGHVAEFDLSHQNDTLADSKDNNNSWKYWDAYFTPSPPAAQAPPNQPKNNTFGPAQ